MDNFKRPNQHRKPESIDGFIPTTRNIEAAGDEADIRRRFRQHYRPTQSADTTASQSFEAGFDQKTDFQTSSIASAGLGEAAAPGRSRRQFDLNLEGTPLKKRRFSLFRRHKNKPKRSLKRRVARGAGISFAVLLLGVGSILGYGYLKARQIFRGNGEGAAALQENVDPSKLNGEGDGRVNILLLGKGGIGHDAPDLTDTILIASIDPLHDEAALLSIPRDLYVQDPNGYSGKINAVYSNMKQQKLAENPEAEEAAEDAGLQALKETVSEVTGIPMHYYVMVNFTAFQEAIDTVGGITIDVKEPLYDGTMAWLNNGNPLIADAGLQTFDGQRALLYARSRHGSARGDFDRTERQREVLVALQQKIMSAGTYANPFKLLELVNTLGSNVRTDLNGTGELQRLYEISQKLQGDKVTSIGLADPPNVLVTTGAVGDQSVVLPTAGLYQYDEIRSFVRNTLRDAFLRQEDARVVILNGSGTAGLATAREVELKSYGYNIVGVDNAPTSDYVDTKIIDLTAGQKPYTASYLSKRLGVSVTQEAIAGLPTIETADFVIILGSNETFKTSTE